MTLIEKYREAIVVLDNYVHNGWHGNTESNAIGFFFDLEEKIIPRYSKGDIVRNVTPPNQQTYEVIKTLYDFESEEEYCLIISDNLRFALTVRSSELERIE